MKAQISDGCIGCGVCADTCPAVFRIGEDGLAEVSGPVSPDHTADAKIAAENCPVSVITVEED